VTLSGKGPRSRALQMTANVGFDLVEWVVWRRIQPRDGLDEAVSLFSPETGRMIYSIQAAVHDQWYVP
jgi:hypothetical protein